MACTGLTKGRGLICDRTVAGVEYIYLGVYDEFNSNADTGEIYGTGIIVSTGEVTDIEMGTNDLYRYALPRGESSFTETIVGSTENGTIHYQPSISLKINQLTKEDQNQVRLLAKTKVVAFVQLNQKLASGNHVIVGMGMRNGLNLNAGTNISGAAWGDHGGYSWTFDGLEEDPMAMVADYTTVPFDNAAFTIGDIVIT